MSESSRNIMLSGEQLQILHGSGNQVIVAGAGTGKTETLTQRVLHLLMQDDSACHLHELTALTFTDKAAGEMRQRVYQSILKRLIEEADDERRTRLNTLRTGFADQNRIGTFDSFIHRLLSLYPEQNLVPPGFSPMSSYDERDLHAQLVRAFWQHAEDLQNDERDEFFDLLDLFDRRQLLMLVAEMAREETHHLEALASDVDEVQFRDELQRLCVISLERVRRREGRRLDTLWGRYENELPLDLPLELDQALRDPERLRFRGSDVLTQQNKFAKRFIKPDIAEWCEQLEAGVLQLLEPWRKLDAHLTEMSDALSVTDDSFTVDWEARQILRRLARLSLWWAQQRRELCWRNGWADFTDLQRAALQLLTTNDDISDRLRAGCRHILIDEFQDTNIAQWRLIDCFRSENNVLIVGDGKQAIYQFRGGDITVFEEVQNILLGENEPDSLTISRRSAPVIVEFCNLIFEELLPHKSQKEAFEAEFQALESWRENSESGVYVVRAGGSTQEEPQLTLEFDAPAKTDETAETDELELDEPARLAQAVALLLAEIQADADAGTTTRRPEYSGISEKIRRNEAGVIGLLFRTHERKALFESALREHDVRFVSVRGIGFYQSQQVMDVINLARFFFDTADSLALAGVLRSPLVGLSDRALLELHLNYPEISLWQAAHDALEDTGDTVSLAQDDWRALRIGVARLECWRDRARVQPFSAVLELIWRESELAFCDALHSDAPQRIENWRKIIEVLRDREERGHGSVREIVEFLSAQASEEENEADAALPGNSGSIQLMTIFAAKGLGFDMTIVAQTDGLPRSDSGALKKGAFPTRDEVQYCIRPQDDTGRKQEPLLWTILREEERARGEAEFRRLLYVACTRAKDHLLLVLPEEPKSGSWAAMLAPFVSGMPTFTYGDLRRHATGTTPAPAPTSAPVANLELLPPLSIDALPREISVTGLFERLQPPQHRRPSVNRQERRECGRVVHRLLELNTEVTRVHVANLAFAHNLPESVVPVLQQQVRAANEWLQQQGYDLSRARREVPFSVPASALWHLAGESQVQWVNGTIDLMVPEYSGWAIIDFKTGREEAQQQYMQQLQVYVAAAEYSGLAVSACWLLFLHEDGAVLPVSIPLQQRQDLTR